MPETLEIFALISVFVPLFSAAVVGASLGRISHGVAQTLTCLGMLISALMAIFLIHGVCFSGETVNFPLLTWIHLGNFQAHWGIFVDPLTAVMMGVVTGVSLMVHIYAIGYMHGDHSVERFMSYLSLFTFFMLMLVTAPNLMQLFFGWEGVGLASYLLIGFWTERKSATAAAMKAFLVNRVADIFLALGVFSTFCLFDAVSFQQIFPLVPLLADATLQIPGIGDVPGIPLICGLFFVGAMGKSAQLGLHTWLPDAMEGPTPVSALIHAATMVTAGVFLMARLSPFLEHAPCIREVILIIGGLTAFFAATVACTQTDIKRVIAYSTCSQLGYMFMAIGVSAYSVAIFHLMTHAFFKALLFLGAGSVIHAMSGEQDLRKMGGIWHRIPFTYGAIWIGSLALAGIPYFSGYYSKDAILEALWATGSPAAHMAFSLALAAAFLTAFYSWRLIILAFHGPSRAPEAVLSRVHESPVVMTLPLAFLGFGAILAGFLTHHLFIASRTILGSSIVVDPTRYEALLHHMHHLPPAVVWSPLIVAVCGIALAGLFYGLAQKIPEWIEKNLNPLYKFSLHKWYFDELYTFLFVNSAWALGHKLWLQGDMETINRYGPDGAAAFTGWQAKCISYLQTGYLYHYAFAMILGILGILTGLLWF